MGFMQMWKMIVKCFTSASRGNDRSSDGASFVRLKRYSIRLVNVFSLKYKFSDSDSLYDKLFNFSSESHKKSE